MNEQHDNRQFLRDVKLAAIEDRQLQFLLSESEKEHYRAWLRKPPEYKKRIREIVDTYMAPATKGHNNVRFQTG